MTKIYILNPKLNVPNEYKQFWVHFEWFLSLFKTFKIIDDLQPFSRRADLFLFPG